MKRKKLPPKEEFQIGPKTSTHLKRSVAHKTKTTRTRTTTTTENRHFAQQYARDKYSAQTHAVCKMKIKQKN